ncbi:MAG: TonB-dependent receptor, partial [Proteobacteria bacterium]|nr:TonB-dependent receptor [Pseudomonadota bacterium]
LYDAISWGDHGALSISAAMGRGLRSLEATSLSQNESTPLGRITSYELGVVLRRSELWGWFKGRAIGFQTNVDNDLVFDEGSGRNVFAGETSRRGGLLAGTLETGSGLAANASATYTHAVFGANIPPTYQYYNSDRVPGKAVPYVPPVVARADLTYHWKLGDAVVRHGAGASFVSPRPLPQSQRSDTVFTIDASTSARWKGVELALSVENLLDRRYALAEYNFSSWFPQTSGTEFPTRVPTRQVSPGSPRALSLTLTLFFDELLPHPHHPGEPKEKETP